MPDGRPGEATLVAPEAAIMDMPKTVGFLNGMFSLVKYGLSNCNGGFGAFNGCREGIFSRGVGHLAFSMPYNEASDDDQAEAVVSKLSTLLTSGRLSTSNKQVIKSAYIKKLPDANAALRMAQQLILTTPEFHTTNTVKLSGQKREGTTSQQPSAKPYRAIIQIMLYGGCDSFNILVPHTCTGNKDMYQEYLQVRQDIALPKESLLEIDAASSNQICETFGVHPNLPTVEKMYDDGDLLFFSNTGVLTKETDKYNFVKDEVTRLFSHSSQQFETERVDPFEMSHGTGILGRIADSLKAKGHIVDTISIDSKATALQGTPNLASSPFVLSRFGVSRFNLGASSNNMESHITAMNEATVPESGVFGDFWSESLVKSLSQNNFMYEILSGSVTNTSFPTSFLGQQLSVVAKMIGHHAERGVETDIFFIPNGGWDHHSSLIAASKVKFRELDNSIKAFADEMKSIGMWDDVTVIQTSEFARTLNPNSNGGSDHAWGGNYMMFGGSVRGRQIVGTYPDVLTDDGDNVIFRGRMVPTTSWDAVFFPLAEWAGATADDFKYICPNQDRFPESHFIDVGDLFEMNTLF